MGDVMILLQASHISKSFGTEKVLDNVSLAVKTNERIGLIGANGTGKSTLLKIINGQVEPDNGKIARSKDVSIGYLEQNSFVNSEKNVWDEMINAFEHLVTLETQLRNLEKELECFNLNTDKKKYNQISEKYSIIQEQFRNSDGYTFRSSIKSVLYGLSFSDEDFTRPISTLSGGQQTRLALGKLLTIQPNLLILDEPTNYLDMDTVTWLEKYLLNYSGSILVVSHDRYFLDKTIDIIYELEGSNLTKYNGNYSQFLQLKNEQIKLKQKEYTNQQNEMKKLRDFVDRNKARASTSGRAKAKEKQLLKLDPVEKPVSLDKQPKIGFKLNQSSGTDVLRVNNLSIGYSSKLTIKPMNFTIYKGDRIALLGANGIGKTTLLKTITGQLLPLAGDCWEGHNVSFGLHRQQQEDLSANKSVLAELWDDNHTIDEKVIRGMLGRFLFTGDEVYKEVSNLSGGEKSRLSLAKLMCQNANFLILDEPTNHLDFFSKEALEDALQDFPGTILFVSHDRYFINKLANRIFELTPHGILEYEGNYEYYLEKRNKQTESVKENNSPEVTCGQAKLHYLKTKETQRQERKRRQRIEQLEKIIKEIEQEITFQELELTNASSSTDFSVYQDISTKLETLRVKLDRCLEEWLDLQE